MWRGTSIALAVIASACGRLGFDAVDGTGDGGQELDAAEIVDEWTQTITTSAGISPKGIGGDAAGNVYVAATFGGTAVFEDGTSYVVASNTAAIVASFSPDGALRWSHAYEATGLMDLRAIDVASSGETAAVGLVTGAITVGGQMMNATAQDPWLIRHDAGGGVTEATKFSAGNQNAQAVDVSLAESGAVAVTGNFLGTVDFGTGTLTGGTVSESGFAYVRQRAATTWAHQMTESSVVYGLAAAIGDDGSSCFGGLFEASLDLGGGLTATGNGGYDVWLAGYDPAGSPQWLVAFGSSGDDFAVTAAVAPDGSCVFGGRHSGNTSGGVSIPGVGDSDGFLVRVLPGGNVAWAYQLGGTGFDIVNNVAIAGSGTIYVGGELGSSINVAGISLTGQDDAYVIAFDPDGAGLWSLPLLGAGDASFIDVDPIPGGVLVSGNFTGTLAVGADTLVSGTNEKMFVHQFAEP